MTGTSRNFPTELLPTKDGLKAFITWESVAFGHSNARTNLQPFPTSAYLFGFCLFQIGGRKFSILLKVEKFVHVRFLRVILNLG